MRLANLSEMQLDALTEVGSIGAGHAATALSQLMGKAVELTQPRLDLVLFSDIPGVLGGPERLVGAVYARILGDLEGGMLFMAERDSSLALCDLMRSRAVGTTKSFGHEEEALVTHIASILMSAYVAAMARLADVSVLPSSPSFALDMAGAILQVAAMEVGSLSESALVLRTSFFDEDTTIDVALLHVPAPDSLEVLLGRLGGPVAVVFELDKDAFPELDHPNMIQVGVGELAIAQHPQYLMTPALGSCVGVTLYDPVLKQGGLAHVMLPEPLETSAPTMRLRFATVAIPEMATMLMEAGSPRRRLVAKLAGGASMFAADSMIAGIGKRNVAEAKRQLGLLNVRVVAEDTGKRHARTIELRLDSGVLVVRSFQYGVVDL